MAGESALVLRRHHLGGNHAVHADAIPGEIERPFPGERIQRTWSGGEEERRRPVRAPGVPVGGEPGRQFGPHHHGAHAARSQRVPHTQGVDPGHAERRLDAQSLECLGDDMTAVTNRSRLHPVHVGDANRFAASSTM